MLHEGSHYGVSVLCESQAALSDRFAGRPCEDCPNPQFDLVRETPLVDGALARLLSVGPPDGAERAMLGASANRLD